MMNQNIIVFYVLDNDSDESNSDVFSSKSDIDAYSVQSDSDIEYISKKCYNRKKINVEEKSNNNKIIKRKRKKIEPCIQSNYIKRDTSVLRLTTSEIYNSLETKGILNS